MRISDWRSDVCSSDLKRWYEQDDASALPRTIASFAAFENAMSLDIAMGGSTNTVLHLLAAAQEAGVEFTMADIDRLSRRVPCLCKVAPTRADVHMEDVHRAGGIMAILGELRSEEHTSELQSLMRISYAVFCLKKKKNNITDRNRI